MTPIKPAEAVALLRTKMALILNYSDDEVTRGLANEALAATASIESPTSEAVGHDGWQWAPKVATEEMIRAGCLSQSVEKFATYEDWWNSHSGGASEKIRRYLADEYASMVAATSIAPPASQEAPSRTKLLPMPEEDGTVNQWYFDCDGHYIDVVREEDGKCSIFFRNRADGKGGWFSESDQPPASTEQAPSKTMMKADPTALAALALSGALPVMQAGEILNSIYAPGTEQAPSAWKWPTFESWLASPIETPASHIEYVRLAFNSGRAEVTPQGALAQPVQDERAPSFGPIGFGLTDRQVMLETAVLLMEKNWRGDLAETLRDMAEAAPERVSMPEGYVIVPIEPTESMVVDGFESVPDPFFTKPEVWEKYAKMTGCQQSAFRTRLCWAAMIAAAPLQKEPK